MKTFLNFNSIRSRLLIAIMLFITLMLSTIAITTYLYFMHATREEVLSRVSDAVAVAVREIDSDIELRQQALTKVAVQAPPDITTSRETAQKWLDTLGALHQLFSASLIMLDKNGVMIASYPHRPDDIGASRAFRDYFKTTASSGKPYISEPFVALSSKKPAFMMAVPLRDASGTVTGVLCGRVDLLDGDGLLHTHQDTRLGKGGYLYLVGKDRTMIMHPDSSRVMKQSARPGENKLFDRALLEGYEGSGETINSKGVHLLSAFKRLHSTGWIMAANIPAAEAFQGVRFFRNTFLPGVLLALLASIVLVFKIGTSIVRPLDLFTGQIKKIAASGADHRIELSTTRTDELGQLAVAFNALQDEVLKRTQEAVTTEVHLREQEQFVRATLNSLSAHICVLDSQSRILITNRAWDAFAVANNAVEGTCGVGSRYIDACQASSENGESYEYFVEALREVIGGTLPEFTSVYPCHSPDTHRWFLCKITSFTVAGIKYAVVSHENISEQKLFEIELRKLTRAVTQSPVATVITDLNGAIEFVSPRFSEVTGYTFEEAIGQNPRILKTDLTPPETFKNLWSTISKGNIWEGEFVNKKKDGQLFWEHAIISALRDDSGKITHYLAVKEDITEKKAMLEKLHDAKEKAEAATQAKSSFLSTMSHEIRTPMNGVIGMTSLLIDTDLSPEQRDYAEIIRTSGENLLSLINDILDFSKIEAGKFDLEILEFDLRTMMEDTVELLSLRAGEKGIELICRVDPAVPWYLRGDPGRVRQIFTNLIGNAIKFTGQGEVVVSASLQAEEETSVTLLFEVTDSGIGIAADRLDDVFAPFTQADSSTTRQFGGTGLGLAICRQLAELMGGTIGVSSTLGTGSTFWFTIRFEKHLRQDIPGRASDITYPDIAGTRILVVDDNATNRKLMTTLLHHWGCRFETAADGAAGLMLLHEAQQSDDQFQLVLLDQEMPEMDGLELGRRIKADPQLSSTLLIMATSMGRRGDAAMLEQIGFDGYLSKPVRQSQLHDCISLVLGKKNAAPDTQGVPQGIVTRYTVAECLDHGSRILLAEDNIINQKVAQIMLNKLGYKADVVCNGLEAVRALELINYDLVLMDCQMPEMDGFDATRTIRDLTSNVRNHNVPIVALTANAMQSDREYCLEVGMNDYLAKPVKKVELDKLLEKWLKTPSRCSP